MKETADSTITTAPTVQKFERKRTLDKEHKDALDRAVSLNVPHAVSVDDEASREDDETQEPPTENEEFSTKTKPVSGRTNWDEVVEKLFHRNESGGLLLRKDVATATSEAPHQSQ
ncbi:sn1-specific diacylglycerol lipase alpha [Cucumis melo var. makuwa]|nr:sn1-specific diacylglycerol lipase alpha [Cucumis melo var. makuwa]